MDKLYAKGITGKGIYISIVDSGINYKYPVLGGYFSPGYLVITGYDFIDGDADLINLYKGYGIYVTGIITARRNP